MGANAIRAFIAIDLSTEIQTTIGLIQSQFKALDCNIKWVEPKNTHLTLKFLGEVKLKEIDTLKKTLSGLLTNMRPIETELTQPGTFPHINYPQILWVGLKDEDGFIQQIALILDKALGKIGYKKNAKPFSPHITIGRVRSPRNLDLLSKAISDCALPSSHRQILTKISLIKSSLAPRGPTYEPLHTIIL